MDLTELFTVEQVRLGFFDKYCFLWDSFVLD